MDFPEFYKKLEAEFFGASAKLMGLQLIQLELILGKIPSRSFSPIWSKNYTGFAIGERHVPIESTIASRSADVMVIKRVFESKLSLENVQAAKSKYGLEHASGSWNLKTPQQNRVAERKNRTLIESARTMLADSKLPTTFWAEAVNTACYVQNRVLVTNPHNKTPYELFLSRKPTLGFMRPFGCPVTILNTIDHLVKFDGKVDKGFFVGYSINSKAFREFNSRTRIVEQNLHVQFSKNTPNIVGSGPNWLFDIDALTKSMNYKPIFAGNQSKGNEGTKACDDACKVRMETEMMKRRLLKNQEKKVVIQVKRMKEMIKRRMLVLTSASTNEVNAIGRKSSIELLDEPNMYALEDIVYSDDDEDVGAEADMKYLDAFMPVSLVLTTRVHKD
ncbi:ribonuclease H-like domain-containing protein, partial [Tanacetum coccineum]